MKYVLLVLTLIALAAGPAVASVPDDLQRVSVTIKAGNAQGSGTLVTRQIGDDTVTFIWTAAHVVDGLRTTRTVVTPQGTPRIVVEYRDAEIVQERQQGGRRVGEVKYDCKVIKVSDADYGEDLAVLMVRCKGAYPLNVCAKFHKDIQLHPAHRRRVEPLRQSPRPVRGQQLHDGRSQPDGPHACHEGCQRQGLRPGDGSCLSRLVGRRHVPQREWRVHRDAHPGRDEAARLQLHRSRAAHPCLGEGRQDRVGHRPQLPRCRP